jgi:acetoin utilization deacetylase AcuC-like enzyme
LLGRTDPGRRRLLYNRLALAEFLVLPFKLLYDPRFIVDLGPHVFPARKYELVRALLVRRGVATDADFAPVPPASDADVLRVHTREYLEKVKSGRLSVVEQRTLEVPWSRGLVDAAWCAAGAAIEAGRLALRDGCAVVLSGGFHHAFADHGEGFCLINDVAIAVRALQAAGAVRRVAVLDLDVHQGNGTASILGDDPDVLTVSVHQEANYPAVKPPSHLDVGLADGAGDREYLEALAGPLSRTVSWRPDLLFYLAGADPYEHDQLGGLKLTLAGLQERDRRVFEAAREASVPVVVVLAGGYAARTEDTVTIHVNTVASAASVFGRP